MLNPELSREVLAQVSPHTTSWTGRLGCPPPHPSSPPMCTSDRSWRAHPRVSWWPVCTHEHPEKRCVGDIVDIFFLKLRGTCFPPAAWTSSWCCEKGRASSHLVFPLAVPEPPGSCDAICSGNDCDWCKWRTTHLSSQRPSGTLASLYWVTKPHRARHPCRRAKWQEELGSCQRNELSGCIRLLSTSHGPAAKEAAFSFP